MLGGFSNFFALQYTIGCNPQRIENVQQNIVLLLAKDNSSHMPIYVKFLVTTGE